MYPPTVMVRRVFPVASSPQVSTIRPPKNPPLPTARSMDRIPVGTITVGRSATGTATCDLHISLMDARISSTLLTVRILTSFFLSSSLFFLRNAMLCSCLYCRRNLLHQGRLKYRQLVSGSIPIIGVTTKNTFQERHKVLYHTSSLKLLHLLNEPSTLTYQTRLHFNARSRCCLGRRCYRSLCRNRSLTLLSLQ